MIFSWIKVDSLFIKSPVLNSGFFSWIKVGLIVYQVFCIKQWFFYSFVYQVSCIKQWFFPWIKVDSLFIKSPVLNSDFLKNQSGLIVYEVSCIKQWFFHESKWTHCYQVSKVDSLFIKSPVLNSDFLKKPSGLIVYQVSCIKQWFF